MLKILFYWKLLLWPITSSIFATKSLTTSTEMLRYQRSPLKVSMTETTAGKGREDSLPWHSGEKLQATCISPCCRLCACLFNITFSKNGQESTTASTSPGAHSTGESRGIGPSQAPAHQFPLYNLPKPHSQDLYLVPWINSWPQV